MSISLHLSLFILILHLFIFFVFLLSPFLVEKCFLIFHVFVVLDQPNHVETHLLQPPPPLSFADTYKKGCRTQRVSLNVILRSYPQPQPPLIPQGWLLANPRPGFTSDFKRTCQDGPKGGLCLLENLKTKIGISLLSNEFITMIPLQTSMGVVLPGTSVKPPKTTKGPMI